MSGRILEWLSRRAFPRVTVTRTTRTYGNLNSRQQAAFDRAFKRLDEAIAELDEVFKA